MEEHVVDTSAEHQVHVWLHLAQGGSEVLGEPSEGLARCIFLASDVCGRRSIFQHAEVAEVRTSLAWVFSQPLNAEVGETESLNLRDVNGSIAVDEVGRRTMCLVASDGTTLMRPFRPLFREVVQQHIAESLTVVAYHLCISSQELWEFVLQLIAVHLLKLG